MKSTNSLTNGIAITVIAGLLILLSSCKTNPPNAPETIDFGKVFISADVIGAKIWLDGNDTGKLTPDTVEAKTGMHEISLTKEFYFKSTQNIEIVKDRVVQLDFIMQEIPDLGRIYVTSNVSGAVIFLDDENTGKLTPDTVAANSGLHHIELQRPFYINSSQDITIIRDSLISINFNLQEEVPQTTVLLEDFANVSCDPCVISNKIIVSLTNYTYGFDKLIPIKYPTNFPSPNDPFYLANREDCNARMGYYNIFVAPTTIIDGTARPTSTDSISIKSAVDQSLQRNPRFKIHVSDNIVGSTYYTTVTIKVVDGSGLDFSNLVLHTVLTETDIEIIPAPGSNGETKFYDVMRVMTPSNSGESLAGISQTEEVVFHWQTTLNPGWIIAELHTVAFIQNKSTKEVYQAGSTL
jgi:hypothetical protein